MTNNTNKQPDIILIGAGIMSVTLRMLLKQLALNLSIAIFERLDAVAAESSAAWNNASTGHYTLHKYPGTHQPNTGIGLTLTAFAKIHLINNHNYILIY